MLSLHYLFLNFYSSSHIRGAFSVSIMLNRYYFLKHTPNDIYVSAPPPLPPPLEIQCCVQFSFDNLKWAVKKDFKVAESFPSQQYVNAQYSVYIPTNGTRSPRFFAVVGIDDIQTKERLRESTLKGEP